MQIFKNFCDIFRVDVRFHESKLIKMDNFWFSVGLKLNEGGKKQK